MTILKNMYKSLLPFLVLASCTAEKGGEQERLPDAEPIVLKLAQKIETDNSFAFDLFKTIDRITGEKNIFISPLSVNMALSMTMNGAKGATLTEMQEALRAANYSLDEINGYNKSLREALLAVDPSTSLTIANSIWNHNTFTLKSDFAALNKNSYDAEIQSLDFDSPTAVNRINNWVSEKTNAKIPNILDRLSAENRICLVNAVYFKGIWESKFNKKNTQKEDFYSEDGVSMGKVDMMSQTAHFPYSEDENARYLQMPYGNRAYSMIVMLPAEGKTLDDVIKNLDNESWHNAMMMGSCEVNLRFPRVKANYGRELQEKILPAMGMNIPFSDAADFSGIANERIQISRVIHKAFIEIDEQGTEAAVATVVVGIFTSAGSGGSVIDFTVNRPFAFVICENSTGVILFAGKIADI